MRAQRKDFQLSLDKELPDVESFDLRLRGGLRAPRWRRSTHPWQATSRDKGSESASSSPCHDKELEPYSIGLRTTAGVKQRDVQ